MLRNKNLDDKVRGHIENLFEGVGESQQLFDLKEELAINLKEKTEDYKARGMNDEHAFKEAVISMGDLSGLVDDMRKLGQDKAKQAVYTSMTQRISTVGIIAGVLLILFGLFTAVMIYFMEDPQMTTKTVVSNGIFIVSGGALLIYSLLTRETSKKYAMNRIRAALYALSVGTILFGIFSSAITYYDTIETYIPIATLMVFFLPAVGLFLYLSLTATDRRKNAR